MVFIVSSFLIKVCHKKLLNIKKVYHFSSGLFTGADIPLIPTKNQFIYENDIYIEIEL